MGMIDKTVNIKAYGLMGKNLFDQLVKSDLRTYDNIRKIETSSGDDFKTRCLLDYPYFKKYHKLIAIDSSKQRKLNVDPN